MLDQVPVGAGLIEPHPDPARGAEIGRLEIDVGVHLDEHLLLLGAARLDEDGGDVVGMMVVPEIGEHPLVGDAPAGRAVRDLLLDLRQRRGERADSGVDGLRIGHGHHCAPL